MRFIKEEISKEQWIRDSKMIFYFGALFFGAFILLSRTSGAIKVLVLTVIVTSAILMLYFSFKLEMMKKDKNLKTYSEILDFLN